jgi:hypothetical protein
MRRVTRQPMDDLTCERGRHRGSIRAGQLTLMDI